MNIRKLCRNFFKQLRNSLYIPVPVVSESNMFLMPISANLYAQNSTSCYLQISTIRISKALRKIRGLVLWFSVICNLQNLLLTSSIASSWFYWYFCTEMSPEIEKWNLKYLQYFDSFKGSFCTRNVGNTMTEILVLFLWISGNDIASVSASLWNGFWHSWNFHNRVHQNLLPSKH